MGVKTKQITKYDAAGNKSVSDGRLAMLLKNLLEERVVPPRWARRVAVRTHTAGYRTRMDTLAMSSLDARMEYAAAESVLDGFIEGRNGFLAGPRLNEEERTFRIERTPLEEVADLDRPSSERIRPFDIERFVTKGGNNINREEMDKYLGPFMDDLPELIEQWSGFSP